MGLSITWVSKSRVAVDPVGGSLGDQESRTLIFPEGRFRWAGKGGQVLQTGSFCEATQCCATEQRPSLRVALVLFVEQGPRWYEACWGTGSMGANLVCWLCGSASPRDSNSFVLFLFKSFLSTCEWVIILKQKCDEWLSAAVASHTFRIQPGSVFVLCLPLPPYLPSLSNLNFPACVSARVSCSWLPAYHFMHPSLIFYYSVYRELLFLYFFAWLIALHPMGYS